MPLNMWTYDLAREQSPTPEFLARLCKMSLENGYDALGLYMEHRFAYPSAPWAAGKGALEPETIKFLQKEFPSLRLIPFINLLGHMEGFIYSEKGSCLGEERFKGLQACPSNPKVVELAKSLLDNILNVFNDELVHIGGDETSQLGICARCAPRLESEGDGRAQLYAEYFIPLIERVKATGKRAGIWGDMLLEHPEAMATIPKDTLVFDWQYFDPFEPTTSHLRQSGFEVIACPTAHTYNATWCHVQQSRENVAEAHKVVKHGGASGVCLTTWECALMGNYETILPIIASLGPRPTPTDPQFEEWSEVMSDKLQKLGGPFAFSKIRSGLKCRMLLYGNPFLTWMHHSEELRGETGDIALQIAAQGIYIAPNPSCRGVAVFLQKCVEFVRQSEKAHLLYADNKPGDAAAAIAPMRQIFEDLEKVAVASNINAGGSLADIERCKIAKRHMETVMHRVKQYGDGSLGYLPSWETITHPRFVPHDQGNWWLINRWANE